MITLLVLVLCTYIGDWLKSELFQEQLGNFCVIVIILLSACLVVAEILEVYLIQDRL